MQENLNDPNLQPDLPNYPLLDQLVRVTSPTIGGGVYPAVARQWAGGTSFRDREACYVFEPNGVSLFPATYDCRLVGNYLGLPLYAASCCVSGGFSSTSSGGGAVLAITALGSAVTTSPGPTTLSYDVSFPSGLGDLVVDLYQVTNPGGYTVKANGVDMIISKLETVGLDGFILQYVLAITGPITVTIAINVSAGVGLLSNAYSLTGLVSNVKDASISAHGNGGTASTGASSVTTASGGVIAAFGFDSASIGSLAWGGSFTGDSGIYQHALISGTDYWLVSGHRTIGSGATFNASLSGVTLNDWGGVGVSYK